MPRIELPNVSDDLMETIDQLKQHYRQNTVAKAIKEALEKHPFLLERIRAFEIQVNNLKSEVRWYEGKFDQLKRAKQMEIDVLENFKPGSES